MAGSNDESNGIGLWREDRRSRCERSFRSDCPGVETITRTQENKLRKTLARIETLAGDFKVEKIVLGFPKHMNNDIGERAEKTLAFKEMLERRTGLEVELWDERLTTVSAEKVLMESGVRRENRKLYIDKIAAVFILQGYLDSVGMRGV